MTTASNEERLARLESGQKHVATKADIARLESRQDRFATKEDLAQLETRLAKWIVGAVITAAGVAIALATLIERIT